MPPISGHRPTFGLEGLVVARPVVGNILMSDSDHWHVDRADPVSSGLSFVHHYPIGERP